MGLMAVRSAPALVRRRSFGLSLREPVFDQFLAEGLVLLADDPEELVLGAVGRFWTGGGLIVRVARGEFAEFGEPGYAKAAINFRADGATLSTETRMQATDDEARRHFGRYWRGGKLGGAAGPGGGAPG